MLGPRGSGKTSTLHRLAHLVRQRSVLTLVLDGRASEDTMDLLGMLAWRLGVTELTRRAPGETERLLSLLESVDERLRAIGRGTVVVLIDELARPDEAHRLFGRLRDDLWRLPVTWVVSADETDRAAYLKPPADAFFGRVLALEPLDEPASRTLLQQRAPELEERAAAVLVLQGAGNPRNLIRLAQQVLLDEVDPAQLLGASLRHAQALQEVGEPARRLYDEVVASGAVSMSEPALLRRLGWTRPRAQQVITTLLSAGLVEAAVEHASRGRPRKVYRAIPP